MLSPPSPVSHPFYATAQLTIDGQAVNVIYDLLLFTCDTHLPYIMICTIRGTRCARPRLFNRDE